MSWPKEKPFNRYPSDLTDAEWETVQPLFEEREPNTRGRPREVDLREILNAIFYINKTGCQWRYLPKDFPAHTTVSTYYHRWINNGVFEKINTALHRKFRQEVGRNETPSAAIIDSQAVKGTQECADETGFDGGKLVKGRKRHILVDTMGCLIYVGVHAANIPDVKGAPQVLKGGYPSPVRSEKFGQMVPIKVSHWLNGLRKTLTARLKLLTKIKKRTDFRFYLGDGLLKEASLGWGDLVD